MFFSRMSHNGTGSLPLPARGEDKLNRKKVKDISSPTPRGPQHPGMRPQEKTWSTTEYVTHIGTILNVTENPF